MQLLDVPFSPNKDKTGYYIKAAEGSEYSMCVRMHVCMHVAMCLVYYVNGWANFCFLFNGQPKFQLCDKQLYWMVDSDLYSKSSNNNMTLI